MLPYDPTFITKSDEEFILPELNEIVSVSNYGTSFAYVFFYKDGKAKEVVYSGFTHDVPLLLEKDTTYRIGLGLWDEPTYHSMWEPIRTAFYTDDRKINFIQVGSSWKITATSFTKESEAGKLGGGGPGILSIPVKSPKALLLTEWEIEFPAGLRRVTFETWAWVRSQRRSEPAEVTDQLHKLEVTQHFWALAK